ncbi:MAG TPA: universal stress protein [Sphingobacterium sp.]|nr:universal stress protein [Sphingobacterium sp.]
MKTLLVPIDFSENAIDAVQYAVHWSNQLESERIILYHSSNTDSTANDIHSKELENIKEGLSSKDKLEVICIVNNDGLTEGVVALVREYQVSFIVMGITGRNKAGQKLIGSSVFQISENTDVPVLVIPSNTRFTKVENVALALPIIADLKDYTPHTAIETLVNTLDAKLLIVNVARKKDKTSKPVLYMGLQDIFDMFEKMHPTYHFLTAQNTADSVAEFARDNHAQLLISIAGKYGFLQGMFKSSVTKKLAYHSAVPLLIYHAEGS